MSVIAICTVATPSRAERDAGLGGQHRVAADRGRHAHADQPLARRATWPGFGLRLAQPNSSAPFCMQGTSVRVEKGMLLLGILASARCGCAARSDRCPARRPARPSRIRAPAGRPPRPARASRTRPAGRACTSRCVVMPVRRRVERARRAGRGLVEVLARRVVRPGIVADRGQRAVALGAEPQALDRVGAVGGDVEHLLAGQRDLDGPVRSACAARAARIASAWTCSLAPKPPPM